MSVSLIAVPALPRWARWSATGLLHLRLLKTCRCRDCGVDVQQAGEWYMVHDHIWAQAGTCARGGYLCIGCLEHRIERQLSGGDFTAAPVNGARGRRSTRFTDRLRRI